MDSQQLQQATSNPNIQRVLQKQASLSKRLSTAGQMSDLSHQVAAMQQQQAGGVGATGGAMGGGVVVGGQQTPAAAAGAAADPSGASTRIKIPETRGYSHTETAV